MRRASALSGLALLIIALPAGAREELPAETRYAPFSGAVSECASADVLSRIQSRFASTERRYWSSHAEIVGFEKIRQVGLRHQGLDLIPHRSCEAMAVMSNHKRVRLRYAIIENYGFAGYGQGVSYCLAGHDHTLAAGGDCSRFPR